MKKLIILATLIALLASGMAFGQLTYGGKVYSGALSNFDDGPGVGWDIRAIFTAKIDDFNTAQTRIRMRNFGPAADFGAAKYADFGTYGLLTSDAPFIDRAFLTTDVLGGLGVKGDVGLMLTSGFSWANGADLTDGVSPFEVSDIDQMDLGTGGKQGSFDAKLTLAKMWNVRATVAPNDGIQGRGGWKVGLDGTLPVGAGKLTPEFLYGAPNGVNSGEGTIIFAAKYVQAMGDMGLTLVPAFRYNLDDKVNGGNLAAPGAKYVNADGDLIQYYMALAASIQYQKLATVKLGYLGYDGSVMNRLEANVLLTPDAKFGLEVGTILNLDQDEYEVADGKSMLQVIDIGGFVMAGKTRIKVGYISLGKKFMADHLNHDLSEIGRNGSALEQGGMYLETLVSFYAA